MKYRRAVLLAPSANHLLVSRNEKLVWKFLDELNKDFLSHFHNVVQERVIISTALVRVTQRYYAPLSGGKNFI